METDPEKIRELRRNMPKLTSEEVWDQVEKHIGRRPQPVNRKPKPLSPGPVKTDASLTQASG